MALKTRSFTGCLRAARLAERGAAAIEYSLLIALFAVAIIPATSGLRNSANDVTGEFIDALTPHREMTGPSDGSDIQSSGDDSSPLGDDGSASPVLNMGGGSNGTTRCEDDTNCFNAALEDGDDDGVRDGARPHR